MDDKQPLPPGQYESSSFPRFGMPQFAYRYPREVHRTSVRVGGAVGKSITFSDALRALPRVESVSDFHCVTTWSRRDLTWSGYRFSDFYEQLVKPEAVPANDANVVILKGQDGYRSSLLLSDLLAGDVLLADRLDGESLSVAHGAPLRLVAPAHYGYKNVKHVSRIDFCVAGTKCKTGWRGYMDHPRARVALEERALGGPGWFFRYLYRPLVRLTAAHFEKGMTSYRAAEDDDP